jgi:hypothetical protein
MTLGGRREHQEYQAIVLWRQAVAEHGYVLGPSVALRQEERGVVHVGDRDRLDASASTTRVKL